MTRRRTKYSTDYLTFGDFSLNADTLALESENSVRLSLREFELLQTFVLNSEKELSTEFLLDHIWSAEPEADGDTVWLYVNYLRRKLVSIASAAEITGERGGAYRLCREAQRI